MLMLVLIFFSPGLNILTSKYVQGNNLSWEWRNGQHSFGEDHIWCLALRAQGAGTMLSLVQRGPPCSRWCYGLQPTRSHVYRGSVRPSRLVAVGRREYTAIHSPRRLCAINSASSNSRRPQFSGCSAGCPRGLQQSAPPLSSPVPSKGGEAATGGGSKPRHSLDIRSCLFADCSGSEKQIRSAILSGADAVALDVFSLSDGDELVEGVTRAAEIIEKYTPSYQLHYIQIDANLTQESPLLSTPSERQESLRKKLETFSQAHEKRNLSVDGLVLRNVQNANDILAVERVLASHADVGVTSFWKKRLSFIPVIETPSSYFNALEIAQSSDRNVALIGSSPLFAEYVECKDDSQNETIVAVKVCFLCHVVHHSSMGNVMVLYAMFSFCTFLCAANIIINDTCWRGSQVY